MTNPTPPIKRFFSPLVALVALVILAIGVVITAAGVNGIMNGERVSAKGFILGAVLVVAGVAVFFAGAFKKGCSACKKKFTLDYAEFPPSSYERLETIVNSDDPMAVRSLTNAERIAGSHRACLEVSHCPKCRRVGQLRVIEMAHTGQYDEFKRGTKERAVSPEVLTAALDVISSRGTPPQR